MRWPRANVIADGPSKRPLGADGAGQEPARVAFMPWGGLQLEGRHHPKRSLVKDDVPHLDPIERTRRRPRHQARCRGDHRGNPKPLRGKILKDLDEAGISASAPRSTRGDARRQVTPRARPSSRRRSACCAPSSVRRQREVRDTAQGAARRGRQVIDVKVFSSDARQETRPRCQPAGACVRRAEAQISEGERLAGGTATRASSPRYCRLEDMPGCTSQTAHGDIILNTLACRAG